MRGFTLVELILVTCIISILASMAIPRLADTLARYHAEAAARRVANDLNLAQRLARLSSAARQVSFNVTASSYRLIGVADLDHPTAEYQVRLGEQPYEVQLVSAAFDKKSQISFDGYGIPSSGGDVVIETGGYQATITVDAASGQASWQTTVVLAAKKEIKGK